MHIRLATERVLSMTMIAMALIAPAVSLLSVAWL